MVLMIIAYCLFSQYINASQKLSYRLIFNNERKNIVYLQPMFTDIIRTFRCILTEKLFKIQ